MVFPQILSHISLLSDQWLPRIRFTPCVNSFDNILGGSRLENGSNPPKPTFQEVLDHLPGFENYTFFDFKKKKFFIPPYSHMTALKSAAWYSYVSVVRECLGNTKTSNYQHLVDLMFRNFQALGARMIIEPHYLFSHLDYTSQQILMMLAKIKGRGSTKILR